MFDTKLEVDRHVESCMKKINNETEVSCNEKKYLTAIVK